MKRLAVTLAAVLATSPAFAAPGDAELAAWFVKWQDPETGVILMPYTPGIPDSYIANQNAAKFELRFIQSSYPGTSAARQASVLSRFLGIMPRRGIPVP